MAKVVQTTLQISENNVEQYCIADGLSLNTGGYAIRLYLNGHTQGSAILNDAAKEVLYPSATAHPFKIDSFIRANKSGGSMTISLQFNRTSVQSETGDWGSGLKNKTKEGISDSVVINSNRSTEIKWHIKGSSTVSRFSIASTKLTFYFNQYTMTPHIGTNAQGVKSVNVSTSTPCQGDTVTFSAELVKGAVWNGWYSDAACTNLVSTNNNYSFIASSDVTLYAKCEKIAYTIRVGTAAHCTTSVSAATAYYGDTVTFNCMVNEGYGFKGWYSDEGLTQLVSENQEYVHNVTGNIKLWPKVEIKIYNLILHPTGYDAINFNRETKIKDVECLYENDSNSPTTSYAEWTIYGKYGNTSSNPASLGFYVAGEKFANIPDNAQITDINILIRMGNDSTVSISNDAQLHGIYTAQRKTGVIGASYDQVGTKKYAGTGISQTKVISYILTNTEVGSWMLASLKAGEFGIVLSASYDPPISDFVQHIVNIYNIDISISYRLLPNTPVMSLLFKSNGAWKNALAVFKKTNGAWVEQEDLSAIFSDESSGTASNYLYGGNV